MLQAVVYEFGDLKLDVERRELHRGDDAIKLTRLSFAMLQLLVEAAPRLLSHDEVIDGVWGADRVITPENLSQRLTQLRKALGDDVQNPSYIESVHGQGLRLIPDVRRVPHASDAALESASQDARQESRSKPEVAARRPLAPWIGAAALVLAGIALVFIDFPPREAPSGEYAASPGAVAVLPFVNMSDDPGNEYFSDGVSEEIMNALVRHTELPIIARTSTFQFKDQALDTREIGDILGATHLLEGSVRKDRTAVAGHSAAHPDGQRHSPVVADLRPHPR